MRHIRPTPVRSRPVKWSNYSFPESIDYFPMSDYRGLPLYTLVGLGNIGIMCIYNGDTQRWIWSDGFNNSETNFGIVYPNAQSAYDGWKEWALANIDKTYARNLMDDVQPVRSARPTRSRKSTSIFPGWTVFNLTLSLDVNPDVEIQFDGGAFVLSANNPNNGRTTELFRSTDLSEVIAASSREWNY